MALIDYPHYENSAIYALPQHDGGIKLKVKNLTVMFAALVQTLQPNSVNPIFIRGIVRHRNTTRR